MGAFGVVVQLVQGVQIRLGRGHHDVGIRAVTVDDAPAPGQAHRDFALRVRAAGDVVHRVQLLQEFQIPKIRLFSDFRIQHR